MMDRNLNKIINQNLQKKGGEDQEQSPRVKHQYQVMSLEID